VNTWLAPLIVTVSPVPSCAYICVLPSASVKVSLNGCLFTPFRSSEKCASSPGKVLVVVVTSAAGDFALLPHAESNTTAPSSAHASAALRIAPPPLALGRRRSYAEGRRSRSRP